MYHDISKLIHISKKPDEQSELWISIRRMLRFSKVDTLDYWSQTNIHPRISIVSSPSYRLID